MFLESLIIVAVLLLGILIGLMVSFFLKEYEEYKKTSKKEVKDDNSPISIRDGSSSKGKMIPVFNHPCFDNALRLHLENDHITLKIIYQTSISAIEMGRYNIKTMKGSFVTEESQKIYIQHWKNNGCKIIDQACYSCLNAEVFRLRKVYGDVVLECDQKPAKFIFNFSTCFPPKNPRDFLYRKLFDEYLNEKDDIISKTCEPLISDSTYINRNYDYDELCLLHKYKSMEQLRNIFPKAFALLDFTFGEIKISEEFISIVSKINNDKFRNFEGYLDRLLYDINKCGIRHCDIPYDRHRWEQGHEVGYKLIELSDIIKKNFEVDFNYIVAIRDDMQGIRRRF